MEKVENSAKFNWVISAELETVINYEEESDRNAWKEKLK